MVEQWFEAHVYFADNQANNAPHILREVVKHCADELESKNNNGQIEMRAFNNITGSAQRYMVTAFQSYQHPQNLLTSFSGANYGCNSASGLNNLGRYRSSASLVRVSVFLSGLSIRIKSFFRFSPAMAAKS